VSDHRTAWAAWVLESSGHPQPEACLAPVLDLHLGERRVVVDAASDDGYEALLIAVYSHGALTSLTVTDNDGHAALLAGGD
jgi:hypothetical protein